MVNCSMHKIINEYTKYKAIKQFNFQNKDKSKTCPDCSGQLQPQYYGYSCIDCGQLLTNELKPAKCEDLF
jgi:hypothetical protein